MECSSRSPPDIRKVISHIFPVFGFPARTTAVQYIFLKGKKNGTERWGGPKLDSSDDTELGYWIELYRSIFRDLRKGSLKIWIAMASNIHYLGRRYNDCYTRF